MRLQLSALLLPLIGQALAATSELAERTSGPSCTTFKVSISAIAKNQVINVAADSEDLKSGVGSILNSALAQVETGTGNILGGLTSTKGDYKINMKYCIPEKTIASRKKTIQFLAHPGKKISCAKCRQCQPPSSRTLA